jgi:putative transposase
MAEAPRHGHVRGAPYHPMTQGKIERWQEPHSAGELLSPGRSGSPNRGRCGDYNHRRYHESIHNLTPADVYCGRGQIILLQRERIKRQTIALRRLQHRRGAA